MRVVWTKPALSDLDEIEDFIAEDDYETAVDFVDRLISLGESLTDDSVIEMGTPVIFMRYTIKGVLS